MNATQMRKAALRRSLTRNFVFEYLGEEASAYDTESLITELIQDYQTSEDITGEEFWTIARRHEFDENGLTDAALAAALERSQTGWVALIRRPDGDVQQLSLKQGAPDQTAEQVEATLREFIQFPEGTVISVLPLVG